MRKSLISVCIAVILIFCICGCAQTAQDTAVAEAEGVKTENTDAADEETAIAEENPVAEPETVEEENTETESDEAADTDDISDTIYLKPCNNYQDILDNVYTVIVAGKGADLISSDEVFSYNGIREALLGRDTDEALAGIGYMFYDVDGNGTEELIIADTGPEGWDNRILLMYSLLEDKPVLVIDGWARNRYYLLNDGTIYHEGSGGAAYSVFATFRMAEDGISLKVIDYYSSGYYGDSEWGWFHSTTGVATEDDELIEFENEDVPWEMQRDYMTWVKELDLTFFDGKDWQAAYAEYIESVEYAPYNKYALIFVDEDDIPELVICTGTVATACIVLTFHDGEVDALQTCSLQCNYIEKQNLYWDSVGHMGEFHDHVYTIEDGKWVHVSGGDYIAKELDIEEYDYVWEGKSVSEDEYYENLYAVYAIEKNQNVGSEQYVKLDEMLFRLQTENNDVSQPYRCD